VPTVADGRVVGVTVIVGQLDKSVTNPSRTPASPDCCAATVGKFADAVVPPT
jgi:hypothetical protein